jgi:hypothetical protein
MAQCGLCRRALLGGRYLLLPLLLLLLRHAGWRSVCMPQGGRHAV